MSRTKEFQIELNMLDELWWEHVGSRKLAPHSEIRALNNLLESGKLSRRMVYKLYLTSKHWWFLKAKVLKRDNNMCVQCGGKAQLMVDHIRYPKAIGHEELGDLQTLCKSCHEKKTKYFTFSNDLPDTTKVSLQGHIFKTEEVQNYGKTTNGQH